MYSRLSSSSGQVRVDWGGGGGGVKNVMMGVERRSWYKHGDLYSLI